MSSGKTLVIFTLMFVAMLFVGSIYFTDTLLISLADTSPTYQLLRAAIVVLLISILVTNPPRSLKLRSMIGAWSFLLGLQAIESLFSYQLRLLDGILFLEVAIILAIEALETRQIPITKKPSPAKRIPVVSV